MDTNDLMLTILRWLICIVIATTVVSIDTFILIMTKKEIWRDWCLHNTASLRYYYPAWCELDDRERGEIIKTYSFRIRVLPVLIRIACIILTFLIAYFVIPAFFNYLARLAS